MNTSKAVAYAVSLAIAAAAAPGLAADNAADASAELQEVVVTGTSIKGVNAETSLPVQILNAADVAKTGATTVEELFRNSVPAAASFGNTVSAQATGNVTGAINTISLRGLGSSRTLVLINGERSAVYGGAAAFQAGNAVDISSIPVAALDRIDILKDGASSLYGSDAIAGVVNFVLKSDYQGVTITGMGGTPTHGGGGSEEAASIFAGFGDLKSDRYNINFGINYDHTGQILGADRSFVGRYNPQYGNDVTSSFAFPANVAVPVIGTRNPDVGNCGPYSLNDANFPTQCRFDNSPFDDLEPDVTKLGFLLQADLALDDTSKLYSLAQFSQIRTLTAVQPVPLSYQNPILKSDPYYSFLATALAPGGEFAGYNNPAVTAGTGAFLLPNTSAYYPLAFAESNKLCTGATASTCQPLNLIYRDFADGDRLTEDVANTTRLVGGIKGNEWGWDYDSYVLFSSVEVKDDLDHGFGLYSQLMPFLDTGVINPFGPTTNQAAIQEAQQDVFSGQDYKTRTSLASFDFNASRQLFQTPWGPFATGFGGELRRETFDYNPSPSVETGDIAGEGGNGLPVYATRDVESAYLELNSPIAPNLIADAAVRYDNYQRVGDTVNPKGSLRWQPAEWVMFRGSAGTGFRAPSLTDLYAPQTTSVTGNGTRDPIQCAVFNANNPSCSFQFTTVLGGNPNLQPEKSHEFSVGTVFNPMQNFTVDLDSYWIFIKDQIAVGGLPYTFILSSAATATQFASFITRNPTTGVIEQISQTNANLFKEATSGLDMDLHYFFDLPEAGRISLNYNATYIYKFEAQNPNGTYTSILDQPFNVSNGAGVASRYRSNALIAYDISDFDFSIIEHYQKRYHDAPGSITEIPRFVGQYQTFDIQGSYTLNKATTFTLGVINLFNTPPPYANYAATANNFIGGYDISYGDPRGEFAYLRVTYQFQ
jgi:iron complex outermembrane receptor protein